MEMRKREKPREKPETERNRGNSETGGNTFVLSLTSFSPSFPQIHAIEGAMQQNIETIDWMDNVTRAEALVKLGMVRNMVGYPPHPE
jgi:predicted metalloendopeptidase